MLQEGYLDQGNATKKLKSGAYFFLIGPKGSGKSAVAAKMELESQASDFSFYTRTHIVGDVPHNLLKKIIPGQESAETTYRRAWKYICYVLLYRSLSQDPYFSTDGTLTKADVDFLLMRTGLMTARELSDIVTKSRVKELRAATQNIGASRATLQEYEGINQDTLYEVLCDHVLMGHSDRHHYIFIDGLDRIFSASPAFRQSISALLGAVFDVNIELLDNHVPATIVALVRRDMLDHMGTPDLAKFTGDHGVQLDWVDARVDPEVTDLWQLIDRRASISAKQPISLYHDYLPKNMNSGDHSIKFLLDRTRHRPRDLIELMNSITERTRRAKPLPEDIDSGYSKYSQDYLLLEVTDELKGFLEQEEILAGFNLLRRIGRTMFTLQEAEAAAREHGMDNLDLAQIFDAFFNCGAIGLASDGPVDNRHHLRFKYRNPSDTYNPNADIFVHKGLWRALGL